MKTINKHWLTLTAWLGSWLIIFWINFSVELTLMMHFFAIPVLLLFTALGAGRMLEDCCSDPTGD